VNGDAYFSAGRNIGVFGYGDVYQLQQLWQPESSSARPISINNYSQAYLPGGDGIVENGCA
jgi:hypothetical protein